MRLQRELSFDLRLREWTERLTASTRCGGSPCAEKSNGWGQMLSQAPAATNVARGATTIASGSS